MLEDRARYLKQEVIRQVQDILVNNLGEREVQAHQLCEHAFGEAEFWIEKLGCYAGNWYLKLWNATWPSYPLEYMGMEDFFKMALSHYRRHNETEFDKIRKTGAV